MIKTKEDCFHLGVKALIRNSNNEILLLERNPKFNKIYWDLPGGRLKKGESLIETLNREVKEELGIDNLDHIQPFMTVVTDIRIKLDQNDVGLIFSIFLCDVKHRFSPQLSDEHISYKWVDISDCIKKLNQYQTLFAAKLANLV